MRTIVTPASPRQTHEAGAGSFRTGDVAVWLKSDADIPDGSQGVVLGFKANGRVRLRFDALGGKEFSCPGPPGGVQAPSAFPTANHFFPALLCGRAERLTAKNDGFRPGQSTRASSRSCTWVERPVLRAGRAPEADCGCGTYSSAGSIRLYFKICILNLVGRYSPTVNVADRSALLGIRILSRSVVRA